ncbi:MAG: PIG-L family deacetylase, partial [Planctomycetia bacterium]
MNASAQLPEPLDVIAVGAHPDDVEIGCGGSLALLYARGAEQMLRPGGIFEDHDHVDRLLPVRSLSGDQLQ